MPSSKEVRARQHRQKERVAAALAERNRLQRRRRQVGGVTGVILLVIVVAVGLAVGNNSSGTKVKVAGASDSSTTVAPTTPPTTTGALVQPKQKPCVGLKSALPKGSPPLLLTAGPAPTKLTTQDLKVGTGAVVAKGAKVTVNYVGVACSTGKIFDSSYSRNQTFDADLSGGVIEGWLEGIPGMRIGGLRLLGIPSSLAYGASGSPPDIGPNEALYFLVSAVKLA